jgi:hypothetical protein
MKRIYFSILVLTFQFVLLNSALSQDEELILSTSQNEFYAFNTTPAVSTIILSHELPIARYNPTTQAVSQTCTTNAQCNDGIACTTDVCNMGVCQNTPNNAVCSDGQFCNGEEICNPSLGCFSGTPSCTVCQTCNGGTAQCVNLPNSTPCSGGGMCIDGVCQTLPVELVSFYCEELDSKIRLTWRTASETQNDYFLVQHSTDGVSFRELARIPGAGDSQVENHYEYPHEKPSPGTNYYRLKQVDFDGQFEYSHIVSLKIKAEKGIQVYPNPFSGDFQIEIISEQDEFPARMYDATCRQVWQGLLRNGLQSLELTGLPTGVFWLEVDYGNLIKRVKIVKQ